MMLKTGCLPTSLNSMLIKQNLLFLVIEGREVFSSLPNDILGNYIPPAESVRNLGVWFDADFSLSKHVQNVCRGCFAQLRDFRRIRQYCTTKASRFNLHKLQCIQNSAARIVANTSRFTSISPIRRALHWLPVEHRSIFKTATLVYKFIHTGSPQYFSPYLMLYKGTYQTRHATRQVSS